jgi:hypothetical protein
MIDGQAQALEVLIGAAYLEGAAWMLNEVWKAEGGEHGHVVAGTNESIASLVKRCGRTQVAAVLGRHGHRSLADSVLEGRFG